MKHILFVCTENSARSQMAEGFFNFYNKNPEYLAISAGIKPTISVKSSAIEVMKEKGIDLSKQRPKMLTLEMAKKAHKIYTMGCIESCPLTPPEKTEDWKLENPSSGPNDKFKEVRDQIERKIKKLVSEIR